MRSTYENLISAFPLLLVLLVMAFRVGFRDPIIGSDFSAYIHNYLDPSRTLAYHRLDYYGYLTLAYIGHLFGLSPKVFFTFLTLIQLALTIWMFRKISKMVFSFYRQQKTFLYICIAVSLLSTFFWNGLTNVIRHALAIPFLVAFLCCIVQRHYGKAILFITIATLFHISSILFGLVGFLFLKGKHLSRFIFVVGVLLYLTKSSDNAMMLFQEFTKIPVYSFVMQYGAGHQYRTGFRYDFFFFSLAPILLSKIAFAGLGILRQTRDAINSSSLNMLLNLYESLLIPFIFIGYGAYMDRWLLPAWFLLPIFPAYFGSLFVKKRSFVPFMASISVMFIILIIIMIFPKPWY